MDTGLGGGSIPLLPVPGTSAPVPQFSFLSIQSFHVPENRNKAPDSSWVEEEGKTREQHLLQSLQASCCQQTLITGWPFPQ